MTTVAAPRRGAKSERPTPVPTPLESAGNDGRAEDLATRAKGLRGRSGTLRVDRWLLTLGAALLPLGVVFVILGWQGAAHTPLVFEQIPYLLSGGVLGLALVFIGGFIYFAYWQSVLIRDTRATANTLSEALGRIEALLAQGEPAAGRLTHGPHGATGFVATQAGSMLHRADCPVVVGREHLRTIDPDSAASASLIPCRICEPFVGP